MVIASVTSATLLGVDARPIEVETELSKGLPHFSIIGLGDAAVKEAKYRVQAALRSTELELPHRRVTINLAPAGLRKDGATLDLPMALCLLVAAGQIPAEAVSGVLCVGELALSGDVRGVRGALSIAALAKVLGYRALLLPRDNGVEAAAVEGLEVVAVRSLGEAVDWLARGVTLERPAPMPHRPAASDVDLREIRGQPLARRAAEIAAAGEHNLLLVGNPGSGKTMVARRIPTIMPPLSGEEQLEVTKIWSAAGLTIGRGGLMVDRPFRAPHHTISEAGLIGGGSPIRPGEVSLAHRGVLFLDEMPELPRRVLEVLRQPMEDRTVLISRARHTLKLPASFMLVGAANPCPCGWLGHASGRCWCGADEIQRYVNRISGALLDRIDMMIEAPSLTADELMSEEEGEDSGQVRIRVEEARRRAIERGGLCNAQLSGRRLKRSAALHGSGKQLLRSAIEALQMSARSMERTVRVARTIADLAKAETVRDEHLAEALQYRQPSIWSAPSRAAA